MEEAQKVAVITGTSSGLGLCIRNALLATGWKVYGIDTAPPAPTEGWLDDFIHLDADLQWASEMKEAVSKIEEGAIDLLINCAGVNHLSPFAELEGADWERVMDTNAKSIVFLSQALLSRLSNPKSPRNGGTILNIVSNAAHMPMTHSTVYNASKAAALMITMQIARELYKSHGVTVFSISPNKLEGTGMSRVIEEAVPALRGWTKEQAAEYQRNALPIGEETDPAALAEFIAFIASTKDRHRYFHGCNIPYGA